MSSATPICASTAAEDFDRQPPNFELVISSTTYASYTTYLNELKRHTARSGSYLSSLLPSDPNALACLSVPEFVNLLSFGRRSLESSQRAALLGATNIVVPNVTIFDNGLWSNSRDGVGPNIEVYPEPFKGTLMYSPGALLAAHPGARGADWDACVARDGSIDPEGYFRLYENRLVPLFRFAQWFGEKTKQDLLLTIPGLGCGAFSGSFHRIVDRHLRDVLVRLLEVYGTEGRLSRIKVVYFDPFKAILANETREINGIQLMVRPLFQGDRMHPKPQLCRPEVYQEDPSDDIDFSTLYLMSIVAWDHVSWPGNDFYGGARQTDDGVKAAATSSMHGLTGVEGRYKEGPPSDLQANKYLAPFGFPTWEELILSNRIQLNVSDRMRIF